MKDFFKAFLSFGLATSIEKLLGFVILPIYTRVFDANEYGVIDMIGTILSIAAIFGLLQLETSLQRYYYEYTGRRRKLLVTNVYFLIGGCSLIIGLLIFSFAPFISSILFKTNQYNNLIRIISFQLPLVNLNILGLLLLRYEKENFKFLKVIITKVAFALIFVYLFVIYLKLGMKGVFYAQIFSTFISTILATVYVRHLFLFRFSKVIINKNIMYALPQFPARMGSALLGQADRFFMLAFLSLASIGIYSVSMKLASMIQIVNTAFILAWAPFMHAQFKKANNKKTFSNIFPLVLSVTFLFVCLISLFSKEMVQLLATPDFFDSYKYVGGLSLFFSLYIIKETIDIGPKITEKTKFLSYTFFLSVVVNFISLYLFIQVLQIEGVVLSMIITNLFLVSVSWYFSNKLYYIPFSIYKFILLLLPVLSLVLVMMFIDISITIRIIMAIVSLIFYMFFIFKTYSTFLLQMKTDVDF